MTINKKVLLLTTVIMSVMSFSSHAAVINKANLNLNNNVVSISGNGFEDHEGEYATILVLDDGADITNVIASKVERQANVKIVDGKFSLDFALNVPTREQKYIAYINAGAESITSEFTFTPNIHNTFVSVMSVGDFVSNIKNNVAKFNLDNSVYVDINDVDAALEMVVTIKNDIRSAEELKTAAMFASAIQALNEGNDELVFDETTPLNDLGLRLSKLDEKYTVSAYEQYTNDLSETGKQNVINNITSKAYTSIEAFEKDFILQTTIYAIKNNANNNGTSHISDILTANGGATGLNLDLTNYNANKSTINDLLKSQTYTTVEQLQGVLNTAVTGTDPNPGKPDTSRPSQTGNGITFAPTTTVKDGVEEFVFKDVTENYAWAKDAIKELYEAGIIAGKSNDTFAPADMVTRAEFLKILMGVVGIKAENGTSEFNDVKTSDWYHDYVVTAAKLGLVNGISETEFGANNNITRQDAAVMIARACELTGKTLPIGTAIVFDDADFVAEYAKEAVDLLSGAGIVQGSDNQFLPRADCTRAQAAVMLKNVLDKIEG